MGSDNRVTDKPSAALSAASGALHPAGGSLAQLATLRPAPPAGIERSTAGGELVIGRGIQVKGQIGACKTLVVEGELDASVEVETLLLLEGGLFKGTAVVRNAELAGRLEGKLTVQGKLHVTASARASGEIQYRRIVIEDGGEISGDISVLAVDKAAAASKLSQSAKAEESKATRSARR